MVITKQGWEMEEGYGDNKTGMGDGGRRYNHIIGQQTPLGQKRRFNSSLADCALNNKSVFVVVVCNIQGIIYYHSSKFAW
jgi:hypothetical protein